MLRRLLLIKYLQDLQNIVSDIFHNKPSMKRLLVTIRSSLLLTIIYNCQNIATINKLIYMKYKHLPTYTNLFTNTKVIKNAMLIKAWVD